MVHARKFIIGIVSKSTVGCRDDIAPSIYTRVAYYLPFIIRAASGLVDDRTMIVYSYT